MTTIKDSIIMYVSKVANCLKLCGLKKVTTGIKKTIKPEKNSVNKVRKIVILTFNRNLYSMLINQKLLFSSILLENINYFFIYLDFKSLRNFIIKDLILYQKREI